ncbi:hypothetical protein BHE74_00034143, partial [Ensete ventricosum]
WLIFVRRWQPRDLSRKAVSTTDEEEGSSDVGCGCVATSWLQVASVIARLQRKIAAGSFLLQGSLLATIYEDDSKRSLLIALDSKRCMLRLKG